MPVKLFQQKVLIYSNLKLLLWLFLYCFNIGSAQFSYDTTQIQTIRWSPEPSFVAGVRSPVTNLNGTWGFTVARSMDLPTISKLTYTPINVPGEWTMQGHHVKDEEFGVYKKSFSIPEDWKNKSIKLQFEAVYSECEIWLNGIKLGEHKTGFTGFEFDISSHISIKSENNLTVIIKGISNSDNLSSASTYAVHYLGGISRDVKLVALSKPHIASFHSTTTFDKNYTNATLNVETRIDNQGTAPIEMELEYRLLDHTNTIIKVFNEKPISIPSNSLKAANSSFNIESPRHWNPETPYLYTLEAIVRHEGEIVQKTSKKIGFKQTEIRGNRVFVNNQPIKLRGVNRHEVHPETGRVLSGNQWIDDAKIFKEGNVNYIRTSHYPPSQKFLEACDELGIFVEVEAPFCWASKKFVDDDNYFDQILRPTLEMVEMLKTHPSILHWSAANESHDFEELFKESSRLIKIADPSRPRIFSQWGPDADNGYLELANHHYPGTLESVDQYKNSTRPIVFDEFMHLNAYNRKELATDPGLRDFWGTLLHDMWEKINENPAVLGGAIWAGIDDSFVLPSGIAVGYGTWGPIDGWRREKPEYWHMKKVYSPIKIELLEITPNHISLSIENRNLFTNIKNFPIEWKNGTESGVLDLDMEPQTRDTVKLIFKDFSKSGLYIDVYSPEKEYSVDNYHFNLRSSPLISTITNDKKMKTSISDTEIVIQDGDIIYTIDKNTGGFKAFDKNFKEIIKGLPQLLLLPITGEGGGIQMTPQTLDYPIFSPPCTNRIVHKISMEPIAKNKIKIVLEESYNEALGTQTWTFSSGGIIDVNYTYEIKKDLNPRQVGLIFELPKDYNTMHWKRSGLWSVYPEHHIGRLSGKAKTNTSIEISGLAGPIKKPDNHWLLDRTISGSNDFRSTKRNIYRIGLSTLSGHSFTVHSSGIQSSRAWESNESIHLLIAEFDNPGGERFLRTYGKDWDKKLKRGDHIFGNINIQL